MGRQTGFFLYSGQLGNLVGYYRKNNKGQKEWWTRRAPQNVRQTSATKRTASDFGTASICSRLIRHALHPWLQYYGYHFDHNRLNKAFINVVKADTAHNSGSKVPTCHHMQSLCGFHFNSNKAAHDFLTAAPIITNENDNTTSLLLPGIHISNTKTFKGITHITVKAIAVIFNFKQNTAIPVASETVIIKRSDIHQPITLTLAASDATNIKRSDARQPITLAQPASETQTLIMLEIQCGYEVNNNIEISADKQTAAMDIIAVLPAAKPQKIKKRYRNKTPQLHIIPPNYQPTKRYHSRRRISVYPLKE